MSGTLILGGGPAGATAAIALASAGREVTVIERSRGPSDKVCGDFISAEAVQHLEAMGVGVFGLGARRITRLRLVHRNRMVETTLPFVAAGLSRRILDETLLSVAASRGARVLRGHAIRSVRPAPGSRAGLPAGSPNGGMIVRADGMDPLTALSVFLATGKHDIRDVARPRSGREPIGLKMYYRMPPEHVAEDAAVELILFPGGYAGLLPVEADRLVLCLTVSQAMWAGSGGWLPFIERLEQACPHVRHRLAGTEALLDRPLAVAGIPYGYLHRPAPGDFPGLFRIGDQASVIPSLTGDGISIALHSAALAAGIFLAGGEAADYARALRRDLRWQMRRAGAIRTACLAPAALLQLCRAVPWVMRAAADLTRVSAAGAGA